MPNLDSNSAHKVIGFSDLIPTGECAMSHHLELSAHTAPTLHANILGALTNARHLEYLWAHTRIENIFFAGIPRLKNGTLRPNFERSDISSIW